MSSENLKLQILQLTNSLSSMILDRSTQNTLNQQKPINLIKVPQMPWNQEKITEQFNNFYLSRLSQFEHKFPHLSNSTPLVSVSKVDAQIGKVVYCIGIIKRIQLKRIRFFDKQFQQIVNQQGDRGQRRFFSQEDALEIEDQSGKIKIKIHQNATMNKNSIKGSNIPYGVVVALMGRYNKKTDRFVVHQIIQPKFVKQQKALKLNKQIQNFKSEKNQWKIVILSQPSYQKLSKLKQIIQGRRSTHFSNMVHQIQSVIIIGGMKMDSPVQIKQYDHIVKQMSKSAAIYIMPSSISSKSPVIFPQSKHHRIYYPQSWKKVKLASNPQIFQYENLGFEFIVSAGQNIKDFWRTSNIAQLNEPIKIMKELVKYNHLCPTAPFSIKSKAYLEDYMVLQRPPHLIICGNCEINSNQFEKMTVQSYNSHYQINPLIHQVSLLAIKKGGMAMLDINNQKLIQYQLQ